MPSPVFRRGVVIEAWEWEKELKGAKVVVHFYLEHHGGVWPGKARFKAVIEQVDVVGGAIR